MSKKIRPHHLLLFLAFFLSGCAGRSYQGHAYNASLFEENEKAVVVFKMTGQSSLIGAIPKVSFDLVQVDEVTKKPKRFYRVSPSFFQRLNVWKQPWECLMVEPGTYVIDHISWNIGNTTFKTDDFFSEGPIISVKWGGFHVKPKTVNYVGDLEVSCSNNKALSIKHIDRYEEAKEALETRDPALAKRLAPIDFLPGGVFFNLPE